MTNLLVDHLDRYRSLVDYAQAKYNIFRYQRASDIAVLNAQNTGATAAAGLTPAKIWWFQRRGRMGQSGVTMADGWVVAYNDRHRSRLYPLTAITLAGRHNLENILAATAAAWAMGVSAAHLRLALRSFRGIPDRQELVRTWKGHRFINDTTATTPDGTLAALDVFPAAVFIVGGTDKKLDFTRVAQQLHRRRVPLVFLPGTGTAKLLAALRRAGDRRPHPVVDSMNAAVRQALAVSRSRQTIVLSPGAASFGLFVHEFDRGQHFVQAVNALR